MTPLLDFCAQCREKRLKDVKERLQRLFCSKEEFQENVCGLCHKSMVPIPVQMEETFTKTSLMKRKKSKPGDSQGRNALKRGRSGKASRKESEPVLHSPSERAGEVTSVPGISVQNESQPHTGNVNDHKKCAPSAQTSTTDRLVLASGGDDNAIHVVFELMEEIDNVHDSVGDAKKNCVVRNAKASEKNEVSVQVMEPKDWSTVPKTRSLCPCPDDDVNKRHGEQHGEYKKCDMSAQAATLSDSADSCDKDRDGVKMQDLDDDNDPDSDEESDDGVINTSASAKEKVVVEQDNESTDGKVRPISSRPSNTANDANGKSTNQQNIVTKSKSSAKNTPSRANHELKALRREVLEAMGNSADEEKPYQCGFCNIMPFESVICFLQHVAIHTETEPVTEPFQCRKCQKTFTAILGWKKHAHNRTYKCTHYGCKKTYLSKKNLQGHMKVHANNWEWYQCEVCSSKFRNKWDLKNHVKITHQGIKNHVCRFCGFRFGAKDSLMNHEKLHTGENLFKCDQCDKTYTTIHGLKVHTMVHTGQKQHICEICGFATHVSSGIKIHMATHSTEYPYQCDQCGNRYRLKKGLNVHQKVIHVKVKPHKCKFCDKTFMYKKTQLKHEQTHPEWTGVKKHVCETCGKDFFNAGMLREHINTHMNIKPFVCEYCDYRTSWSRNLILHLSKKHIGEECYPCAICDLRFVSYKECKDHRKICRQKKKGIIRTWSAPDT